jgi:hypothetical protein
MKIYIAGAITKLDQAVAYELFMQAENLLMHAGHTPLNPMKLVDQTEGRKYGEYLADALQVLLTQAEGVYFLENAYASKGARIERFIAAELDIPQYFNAEDLPIGCDWPSVKDQLSK